MNKQWSAEFSVSPELARTLVESQFPSLAPVHVEFVAEGWDNVVFCVNDSFIFRFPRRKMAIQCMEAEVRVLPHLANLLPVPIPNPTFIGSPTDRYPHPFSGYARVKGVPPHVAALTDLERTNAARSFARFQRALHDVPLQQAVQMGAVGDTIGRLDVERRLPKYHEYARAAVELGLLDDVAVFDPIIQSLPGPESVPQKAVLVHGDLNFRNFLVGENGDLSGVIDWGDVHIGDPAVDIAIVHSFLPPEGQRIFWKEYGDIHEETWLLARFRALYVNLYILVYAHDIGDEAQAREAMMELDILRDGI